MFSVRKTVPTDSGAWANLRHMLWSEGSRDEHAHEIAEFFAGIAHEPAAVLMAEDSERGVIGFAELSIRSHAEGCHSDRIVYLEGWFVLPDSRRQGVGRALVTSAVVD